MSALTQHAKSEEEGCRTSEPLDSLIGGVPVNQRGVWEVRNTVCTLVFYVLCSVISCFHALEYSFRFDQKSSSSPASLTLEPPAYSTRYCGAGSSSKRCVAMQLLCRMGQTRGNKVVGERSDNAVGCLAGVWGAVLTLLQELYK